MVVELVGLTLFVLFFCGVLLFPGFQSFETAGDRFRALGAIGKTLLTGHIGWVYGVIVAVLWGLFSMVRSKQGMIADDQDTKARARLGIAAVTLGVAASVLAVVTAFALILEPEQVGGVLGVVVALGAIWFLAVEAGIFVVASLPSRLEAAVKQIIHADEVIARTQVRPKYPWLLVAGANGVVPPLIGWVGTLPWH